MGCDPCTPRYDKIPAECWIPAPLPPPAPEASRFLHGPVFNQSPLLLWRFLICLCTRAEALIRQFGPAFGGVYQLDDSRSERITNAVMDRLFPRQ